MSSQSEELNESLIGVFLGDLKRRGYASSTVNISANWLGHFDARFRVPLQSIKPADITEHYKKLQWEPGPSGKLYSQNTVNQAVGVLKSYFRWCVEQGHLKESPAAHIVTRRPRPKKRIILSPSQARALLALPDLSKPLGLRNRAILGLVVEVQASPGALSRLNLSDFQTDTGAMLLKGRKRRIVSLESGLQADLERYIRLGRAGYAEPGEAALFVTKSGGRMGPAGFQQTLTKHCRLADVPRPSAFS